MEYSLIFMIGFAIIGACINSYFGRINCEKKIVLTLDMNGPMSRRELIRVLFDEPYPRVRHLIDKLIKNGTVNQGKMTIDKEIETQVFWLKERRTDHSKTNVRILCAAIGEGKIPQPYGIKIYESHFEANWNINGNMWAIRGKESKVLVMQWPEHFDTPIMRHIEDKKEFVKLLSDIK